MNLKKSLLKGLYEYGFDKPSAVQQRAIFPIMKGRDIIVQSHAGTVKTYIFAVDELQCLDLSLKETQLLILSPTIEIVE